MAALDLARPSHALIQYMRGLDPAARLAVALAVVGLLAAMAAAWTVDTRIEDMMLTSGAARAVDQVELGLLQNVTAADFEPPYTLASMSALAARLDPLMRRARESSSGILRVNVFAPDGTILYSDLVTLRGQAVSPVLDRRLGAALAGTASTRLDELSSLEDADLKAQHPLAVESYVPFVVDGQVVGAYDLYQDPAPYQSLRLLVRALTAGLLLFALLLAGCAWLAGPARVAPAGEPRSSVGVVARERRLTRRELEVLRLMASDATYREIAEQLVLDEETVRSHAKRILQKLGQPDRKQAVAASQSQGLL